MVCIPIFHNRWTLYDHITLEKAGQYSNITFQFKYAIKMNVILIVQVLLLFFPWFFSCKSQSEKLNFKAK